MSWCPPSDDFEVVGSIVSLHREEDQDQRRVVIYALVDEGYRRVATVLERLLASQKKVTI